MIQNIETFWIFIAAGGEGEGEEVLNLIFLEARFKLESGGGVLGLHSLTCFWLTACKHGRFFHEKSYVIPLKKTLHPQACCKKNLLFFCVLFFVVVWLLFCWYSFFRFGINIIWAQNYMISCHQCIYMYSVWYISILWKSQMMLLKKSHLCKWH